MKKTIVVTGAGRGLGYAILLKHLQMGDTIYALEFRITEELKKLEAENASLTVHMCDVGSTESVADAMSELVQSGQAVSIVYNVAGIHFDNDRVPLEETNLEQCMLQYSINAMGPLRVCQMVVPLLHPGSVVINISSESGSIASCTRINEYGYNMSKTALNMASKTFSNATKDLGVRVFCIHPGWLRTVMGGEGARLSDKSISAEQSADGIVGIALDAENIPSDQMFMEYNRTPLLW